MKNINPDQLIFYHGKGCSECNNGYSGRLGIFEVLQMSSRVEELAVKKAPTSEIKKAAIADGMITMIQDGLLKALKGITTVDEVMRVTTTHTKELPEVAA
jgi:type II secretory ATPase GspE/PulE/Tfp pilus assembly ATPase PilB-like protein